MPRNMTRLHDVRAQRGRYFIPSRLEVRWKNSPENSVGIILYMLSRLTCLLGAGKLKIHSFAQDSKFSRLLKCSGLVPLFSMLVRWVHGVDSDHYTNCPQIVPIFFIPLFLLRKTSASGGFYLLSKPS